MIGKVSNNRQKQSLSGTKNQDKEPFGTKDTVTILSDNFNRKEEKKDIPAGKIDSSSDIDWLIREKQMKLKEREGQLRTYEFFHNPVHKWNSVHIGKKELQEIHGGIRYIKNQIKEIKSELKSLILEKIKTSITPPDEIITYFKTVDFSITPEELDKIGKTCEELKKSESQVKIKGNNIITLEGSEIWQEVSRMLDVKEGPPKIEIDLQYKFLKDPEIYNKVKIAVEKGHKVRIIIDPGTGLKDTKRLKYRDITEYYNALETLMSFQQELDKGNFGICVAKKDNLKDTMHKELLRVGDKVLAGGIDCDKASGEHAGYAISIQGPAAKTLVEEFKKNVEDSKGKTIEEIYGDDLKLLKEDYIDDENDDYVKSTLVMSNSDFMNFLILLLPQESQKYIKEATNSLDKAKRFMEECEKAGINPEEYGIFKDIDLNDSNLFYSDTPFTAHLINENNKLYAGLTDKGKKLFIEKLEKYFKKMNSKNNIKHLSDIKPPDGKDSGCHTISVGTNNEELQAFLAYAIESAEEFLYIPSFCMNSKIAQLIINRQKEMEKEKKKLDIKILLEPSQKDNIESFLALEDVHIPVKWALLDETDPNHDRKLSSNMVVTDKVILTGSADLKEKSLREDQETSVMAFIDPQSEESTGKREEYKKNFLDLWGKESLKINLWGTGSEGPVVKTEEECHREVLTKTVKNIDKYEKSLGNRVKDIVNGKDEIKEEVELLKQEGFHDGYARLLALKKFYSEEDMKLLRRSTGIVYNQLY